MSIEEIGTTLEEIRQELDTLLESL